MKRKSSLLQAIVLRFIVCFIGIEIVISLLETILTEFVFGVEWNFPYYAISGIPAGMDAHNVALIVFCGVLEVAIYVAGMIVFAISIKRKITEPVHHMAVGMNEVSKGNLNVSLDFETETELGEMRDAFNFMAQKLKDSEEKRMDMEKERMRLFSHIAHDLKTPITTISGYSGALANGMVEEPDKQLEYHLAIKAKSDQMNGLVDQLLSYSKLGSPQYRMNMTLTDMAELLRTACGSLFGEMESKQMELELQLPDDPIICKVDPLEMNRAISNLLTNAIRHNPIGSLLFVGLEENTDWITIKVADSGSPIPETITANVFEPFILADDSRSSGRGSGLGLPIVKKVVEQHAGEVFLSDAMPPYTKMFVLKIPKERGKKV